MNFLDWNVNERELKREKVQMKPPNKYFKIIFSRYVRTSALHEDLIYPYPSSSAHVAFRHYLEDAGVVYGSASDVQAAAAERGKKRRRNRR